MEVEVSAEAKDKRLNRLVAITVVAFSVFVGLCNVKDGNIVQAMAQAKADSVDTWNEYQATKIKLHISQTAQTEISLLSATAPAAQKAQAATNLAGLAQDIAKYEASIPTLAKKAADFDAQYDAINVHDDQFDASEALMTTAISVAAVAALSESFPALFIAWAFGAGGIFMGLCGFAGWGFHPDVLSKLLG